MSRDHEKNMKFGTMESNLERDGYSDAELANYLKFKGWRVATPSDTPEEPNALLAQYEKVEGRVGGKPPNCVALLVTEREYTTWSNDAICVTHSCVQEVSHRYPRNQNSWRILSSHRYDTVEELKALLDKLTLREKSACWG